MKVCFNHLKKEEIEKAYIRHIQENKNFFFVGQKKIKKLYKAKKSNDFHIWRERVFLQHLFDLRKRTFKMAGKCPYSPSPHIKSPSRSPHHTLYGLSFSLFETLSSASIPHLLSTFSSTSECPNRHLRRKIGTFLQNTHFLFLAESRVFCSAADSSFSIVIYFFRLIM